MILIASFIVIVVLAAALFLVPAPAAAPTAFNSENVRIFSPLYGAIVPKTFTVTGEARGKWYFEASFPIQVHDANNNRIGGGIAQTQGEWMTTEFVPFSADVSVENYRGPATLALLKDNPSGLPENDDSVSIPIIIE